MTVDKNVVLPSEFATSHVAAADMVVEPEDEFWSARPILVHIRQFARARRRSPWAVLGVSLVRANGIIPPTTALPPHAGGRASLNMFVALTGPSGAGKGTSESAARDAIRFRWHRGGDVDLPEFPIGSGEGIARTFMPPKLDKDGFAEREQIITALFSVPEVDTAAGLFSRSGSTLESELRKVFSGEQLGFTNSQAHTRTLVPAHTYRCSLVVGVQPGRAGALLDGADGGTPQRFVWLPVLDADAPDQRPEEPAQVVITQPRFTGDLTVPVIAREAIDAHQLAMHRGTVDPLDGHRLLVRLKVAAALMVLDNRDTDPVITDDDWHLASTIMETSDRTRAWVQRERAEAAQRSNRGRALATAERDEVISDRKFQRAREAVLRWLSKSGETAGVDLRRRLKADLRDNFSTAVSELADEGLIVVIKSDKGVHYRLAPEGTPCTKSTPLSTQLREGVPEYTGVPAAVARILDFPSSVENAVPKMSAREWFADHIAGLQETGHQTAESFAVFAAGEAAGYTRGTLIGEASKHAGIKVIARGAQGTTWWIDTSQQPPSYQTASEWIAHYVADLPDGAVIDRDDFKARGTAAGYSWEHLRKAIRGHPDVDVTARGPHTTWTVNRTKESTPS